MSENIETYILGACFHPSAVADVLERVSVEDFSAETYKRIFSAIQDLVAQGVTPDPVSVHNHDKSLLLSMLAEIQDACPFVGNLGYMLDKFIQHSEQNRFQGLAATIKAMPNAPAAELRELIEKSLETREGATGEHINKPLKRAVDKMEEAFNNRGVISGIPTGLGRLDEELSGLHKTDMVLIAARPSVGKTALALQIANHASVTKKTPTLFISLEMSSEQLASRLLLSRSKINVSKARNGLFEDRDWPRLTDSMGYIAQAPFYVDDCCGVSFSQIVAKAKAHKMKNDIGLVIIDYLGLVGGQGSEYERVTEASKQTKILAKQLNIPVVALHQLNRGNEKDGKLRKPTMSDLRSSGQLEQDADIILLLHREKEQDVEDCLIIVEKNRHGRTGDIDMTWNGPLNLIEGRRGEYGKAANY